MDKMIIINFYCVGIVLLMYLFLLVSWFIFLSKINDMYINVEYKVEYF